MPGSTPDLSDGELEILRVVWEHQPCSVRMIQDKLNERADRQIATTTVATRVSRMEERKLLKGTDDRRPRLYVPLVAQEPAARKAVISVLSKFYDSAVAASMLRLLPKGRSAKPSELKAIRDEIERM